jgi:hypothetical protein
MDMSPQHIRLMEVAEILRRASLIDCEEDRT